MIVKVLQWSMIIPRGKQSEFEDWFREVASPKQAGFGAVKHELFKVADKPMIGRQTLEEDRYIERVFFNDDFDIQSYFAKVKVNPEAWKISRAYEGVV